MPSHGFFGPGKVQNDIIKSETRSKEGGGERRKTTQRLETLEELSKKHDLSGPVFQSPDGPSVNIINSLAERGTPAPTE